MEESGELIGRYELLEGDLINKMGQNPSARLDAAPDVCVAHHDFWSHASKKSGAD
jgi:hypothetical protein